MTRTLTLCLYAVGLTCAGLALGTALLRAEAAGEGRSALWRIVHDGCVPQARAHVDPPKPCLAVDMVDGEAKGVAFLKDRVGVAQMLAIATRPVSGIEDPYLLQDDAPNYFAVAWREGRPFVERNLTAPLPRDHVALAINASSRRSQDQFHIHVDCLDPQVAATLAREAPRLDDTWRPLPTALAGRIYQARRVDGEALSANPFRLLADGIPDARAHMGDWSLAVVGITVAGQPGFLLLADQVSLLAGGHAEDLQDHGCAIARAG